MENLLDWQGNGRWEDEASGSGILELQNILAPSFSIECCTETLYSPQDQLKNVSYSSSMEISRKNVETLINCDNDSQNTPLSHIMTFSSSWCTSQTGLKEFQLEQPKESRRPSLLTNTASEFFSGQEESCEYSKSDGLQSVDRDEHQIHLHHQATGIAEASAHNHHHYQKLRKSTSRDFDPVDDIEIHSQKKVRKLYDIISDVVVKAEATGGEDSTVPFQVESCPVFILDLRSSRSCSAFSNAEPEIELPSGDTETCCLTTNFVKKLLRSSERPFMEDAQHHFAMNQTSTSAGCQNIRSSEPAACQGPENQRMQNWNSEPQGSTSKSTRGTCMLSEILGGSSQELSHAKGSTSIKQRSATEKKRRERISKQLQRLQNAVPRALVLGKDTAGMLDGAVEYILMLESRLLKLENLY
eukprot:TRINITY_DN2201_c0_g1_i2.p1 TRINITY_DN2201_c0_g1~~TRINITY_DN2201_c0_g1_i2.p1  ORF type:complete len:482 (+),score=36.19 TRINITY_DN2201_c0_g1_i2:207-1448(+)